MTSRRGLFWPLVLITLGLIFLLANLGYLGPVSLVALLSLWPLLLILAGIDIAFARRWPVGALAAEVAVIGFGLVLVATQPGLSPSGWLGFAIRDDDGQADVAVPRDGTQSFTLRTNGGAGHFTLSGGSAQLVEAHSDRSDLRLRRSTRSGRAEIRIDQGVSSGPRFGGRPGTNADVKVASDVTTSLDINYGAGECLIDLRDVRVSDARMNVGASSLELTVPKPSGEVPVTVNAGASSVVVIVPDGVEARITMTGALGSMRSDNSRVGVSGSTAETGGYASASNRVTVRITVGVGSVTVR
jgi:hypothetical protein